MNVYDLFKWLAKWLGITSVTIRLPGMIYSIGYQYTLTSRRASMSLVAINPLETLEFISTFDPDHPDNFESEEDKKAARKRATVFHLGVLDAIFMEKYRARQPSVMRMSTDPRKKDEKAEIDITPVTDVDMLRIGVKDIENFYDQYHQLVKVELTKKSLGRDVEYMTLPDPIIRMLHPQIVAEVAAEVRRINELQEGERKNFDSVSSSDSRDQAITVAN